MEFDLNWVIIVLVLLNGWSCKGCLEEEKAGLLQIKAIFSDFPRSWPTDSDCCQWEKIECNPASGRVIKLDLSGINYVWSSEWYLNASDFLAFEDLTSLDLSYNFIPGCAANEGFEKFSSKLTKLKVLDLSHNGFNESTILVSLSGISSLNSLSISYNSISGSIPTKKAFDRISRSSKLERLDLRDNQFDYSIMEFLGGISSLQVLNLANNRLEEATYLQGLCGLKNLRALNVHGNNLVGTIPSCLGNLTSLKLVDFSNNLFTGHIASSPLSTLISLEFLSISHNLFQVPISFTSFCNHSNLKFLVAHGNDVVSDNVVSVPKFQLLAFTLSYIHASIKGLPSFLFHQSSLRMLRLFNSKLEIDLPINWLLENNTHLQLITLKNCSFIGQFRLPSRSNKNIQMIDLSYNMIEGSIPSNISRVFPSLIEFYISNNNFHGKIPSLRNTSNLQVLKMSNNYFSGEVPESLITPNLLVLKLSNNVLNNVGFSSFPSLQILSMDGNNFVGEILHFFSNASNLRSLDISNNKLHGTIPISIGNMSLISYISMSNNSLQGPIPMELCKLEASLQYFDVSRNSLSGAIPSCLGADFLKHIRLQNNMLSGRMSSNFSRSTGLVNLDVSNNELDGSLPSWIGNLSSLRVLVLKGNRLNGEIPKDLCGLRALSIIDLSENLLSGPIPSCFANISFTNSNIKTQPMTLFNRNFSMENFLQGLIPHDVFSYSSLRDEVLNFLSPETSDDLNPFDPLLEDVKQVYFTTKGSSYSYNGKLLNLFSALDLSCNNFTGIIPPEIGRLPRIQSLNLSYNSLVGSIPAAFSELRSIESLDLSYNHLTGEIPGQLVELPFLGTFSVAHNNLSGKTPVRKKQFGTFEETSYEGNPLLCGPPLIKSCTTKPRPSLFPNSSDSGREDEDGFMDMGAFYLSFGVSYCMLLVGIVAFFYVNPQWRRLWFASIKGSVTSSYQFLEASLSKLFRPREM